MVQRFTINNSSTANLNLSGTPAVTLSGPGASYFSVTRQPASPIANNSSTFDVRFYPTTAGVHTATVSITNNDLDETPYTFVISGTGLGSGGGAGGGGGSNYIYLPLISKSPTSNNSSDLVVLDNLMTASSNQVSVTICNAGTQTVADDFWVDVYFNPSQTPTLNRPWKTIANHGAAWGVTQSLAPGELLTLTTGDAYYFPSESSPPPFPTDAQVYAYVDSVNYSTSYDAVQESNENNNLAGPVVSTAALNGAAPVGEQGQSPALEGLPER